MDRADEFFHRPTEDPFWSESHYFDVIDTGADVAVHGRLGFYPNREVANVFFYLITDGSVYWIRDEAVRPAATHGLDFDTDDWSIRMSPVAPGEAWEVTVDGTVARTPADEPAAVLSGEGEETPLSTTLTVRSRHDPFYYSDGKTFPKEGRADRYEVATAVEGEGTVDGRQIAFTGPGERDHSWGRRKWAGDAEWLWISGSFEDGTAYNHLSAWPAGERAGKIINGFWFDGDRTQPLTDVAVEEIPEFGPETAQEWSRGETKPELTLDLSWDGGTTTVMVNPFVTTPLDWVDAERGQRALFNRAATRQRRDGDIGGSGFVENLCQVERSAD